MTKDIFTAVAYAISGHKDQKRKYTGEPYVLHPIAVAKYLESKGHFREEVIFAALFHDLVDDTSVTNDDIKRDWGEEVATLVEMLTDVSSSSDGNRERRKAIDRQHLSEANWEAQSIKCGDLINNAIDIVANDTKFAKLYLHEMSLTLAALTKARRDVWHEAYEVWRIKTMEMESGLIT